MSSVCHLVIMSSMYILNSGGETGQPWCTPLLNLSLLNVSGIFLDFKILNKISLCILSNAFS